MAASLSCITVEPKPRMISRASMRAAYHGVSAASSSGRRLGEPILWPESVASFAFTSKREGENTRTAIFIYDNVLFPWSSLLFWLTTIITLTGALVLG